MATLDSLKPGDRVHVAPDATWTNGNLSPVLETMRNTLQVVSAVNNLDDGDVSLVGGADVAPRFLTLVADLNPEPAPPITDEQRAAVEWLQRAADPAVWDGGRPYLTADRARVILAALPSELTNPQPALPTEPGLYESESQPGLAWTLIATGQWWRPYTDYEAPSDVVNAAAPFTRLVPERPQITREQVAEALRVARIAAGDPRHSFADTVHAALVNGADQ